MTEYTVPVIVLLSILIIPVCIGYAVLPEIVPVPVSWWFGICAIGIFFLSAYVVHIPLYIIQSISILLIVACITKTIFRLARNKNTVLRRLKLSLPAVILYGCMFIVLLYSVTDILAVPINGQDGIVTWLGKAKDFYFWNPLVSLRYVRYPGLGSMLWAVVMMVFGFHESYGRFIYPVAYIFFVMTMWSCITLKKYTILFATIIAALLLFFFHRSLYGGYQDDFLSIAAGLSTFTLIFYAMDNRKTYFYILGCFFTGMLGLIKSEGVLFGLIIFSTFLLFHYRTFMSQWKEKSTSFILGCILFIFLLGFWTIAISFYGIDPGKIHGEGLTVQGIIGAYKNYHRIPVIGSYLWSYFWKNPIYIIISIVSIIAAMKYQYVRKSILFIMTVIVIHIVFIIWIFLATTTPLLWQLDTSFTRVMDQHASLYIFLAIYCIQLLLPKKEILKFDL